MDWCYFFFKYWIEFLCPAIFPELFFLTTYIFSFLRYLSRGGIAGPYPKYICNYNVKFQSFVFILTCFITQQVVYLGRRCLYVLENVWILFLGEVFSRQVWTSGWQCCYSLLYLRKFSLQLFYQLLRLSIEVYFSLKLHQFSLHPFEVVLLVMYMFIIVMFPFNQLFYYYKMSHFVSRKNVLMSICLMFI